MERKSILVIDDDPTVHQLLKSALQKEETEIIFASAGSVGLQDFYQARPDLVILDILLPDLNGWETCRILRQMSNIPIIVLTRESDDEAEICALENGADDYITKPFNSRVLLARVRAALRRIAPEQGPGKVVRYQDDYLTIDLQKNSVIVKQTPVKLTGIEYRLLCYLFQNADQILTTRQILKNVWGWEYQDEANHVRIYIWHLRRKLEQNPKAPQYLLTEYGIGYRFKTKPLLTPS